MNFSLNYKKPLVIAEIGANHKGDFEIAKELIKLAKESGADVAKFQKRNNKELLTEEQYNAPHPNPTHSYGKTYGEHREFLELSIEQHIKLQKYAKDIGIDYTTSVWDTTSAKEIISLNPKFIKVPSACNNHYQMLEELRDNYQGDIHISMGMTYKKEEGEIIKFFEEKNAAKDRLVIYSCTSGYPVPYKDVCLLEIVELYRNYSSAVKEIGFSGHHLGIAVDIAAYTLGAVYIERHFTKDKTWKGTDHAASLEPAEMKQLCTNLHNVHAALTFKNNDILAIEEPQRKKLKYTPH